MRRLFTKTVYKDPSEANTAPKSMKHYVGCFVIGVVLLLALGYGAFQFGLLINNVVKHWQEIQFAYEKPIIVQHVREDYQKKQSSLDLTFTKPQKQSTEEQIVNAVVQKLKTADLK